MKSRSDRSEVVFPARWSAAPEPLSPIEAGWVFDSTKTAQSQSLDVTANRLGEMVPVAIKYDGDPEAYGFSAWSYEESAGAGLRRADHELPDEEYEVTVLAEAGEINTVRKFVLRNAGSSATGLTIVADDE